MSELEAGATVDLEDGRKIGVIASIDEVREVSGFPKSGAVRKDIARIDGNFARYIALSPFVLLSTSGAGEACDASPRGDLPGFVRVLDERHLVIPERPGNRRADSIQNILETGRAGLLFLIPGCQDTLRVNGRAAVTKDSDLLERMTVEGKAPLLAIVITVEEAYLHCSKAFQRSRLWDAATWPDLSGLPSPGAVYREQLCLDASAGDVDRVLAEENRNTLW